jgi:hypothetical protein
MTNSTGAGGGTAFYPTSGTRMMNKSAGCFGSFSGVFSKLLKPAQIANAIPQRELAILPPVYQQPGPEAAMVMIQPPAAARVSPGRENVGGPNDDYCMPDRHDSVHVLMSRSQQRRHKSTAEYRIGRIPEIETDVCDLMERLPPSEPSSPPALPGPNFGLDTVASPVVFSLDAESFAAAIALLEIVIPRLSPPAEREESSLQYVNNQPLFSPKEIEQAYSAVTEGIPMAKRATERRPLSDVFSFEGSDGPSNDEEHIDTDESEIPMVKPAMRRMSLSEDESETEHDKSIPITRQAGERMVLSDSWSGDEDESFGIPMAQLASCRRTLSVDSECSSIAFTENVDEPVADGRSLAELPTPAARGDSPVSLDVMGLRAMAMQIATDVCDGRRQGPSRCALFDDAASGKTCKAEFCCVSDRASVSEGLRFLPSDVYQPPSPVSVEVFRPDAFQTPQESRVPTSPSVVDLTKVPFLMELHCFSFFIEAPEPVEFVDLDDVPISIDEVPAWLDQGLAREALLFSRPSQAYMIRYATAWDDPLESPIDQSVFAKFDGDFTEVIIEHSVQDRHSSRSAGDDLRFSWAFGDKHGNFSSSSVERQNSWTAGEEQEHHQVPIPRRAASPPRSSSGLTPCVTTSKKLTRTR